ncbi:DUF1853 family protein [Glaciimonas immobilis]|nr:DUF1853 family protein [Glaciimonas immobilis]
MVQSLPQSPQSSLQASLPGMDDFQAQFHQRWNHLGDRHVRALAWLLDSPDLLDKHAPQWRGKIAHIVGHSDNDPVAFMRMAAWLQALDSDPEKQKVLYEYMGSLASTRLGLYAEKLMAFYFQQHALLVAHGLQVRTPKGDTLGEFDFLLQEHAGLAHWEFATKFYLLENREADSVADDFIGPNFSDTLGKKIQKIFDRQLLLSHDPAAQSYLSAPVVQTQALVKGWLFYQRQEFLLPAQLGISPQHCRGYWSPLSELEIDEEGFYLMLPRQRWLAPAKAMLKDALRGATLRQALSTHFDHDLSPVMLATMQTCKMAGNAKDNIEVLESRRGFVVPDDWAVRAATLRGCAPTRIAR